MSLVDLGKRLLEAAKRGDTDEVRTLMSNGAPFTTDWLGTSPLHFASQFGHGGTAEVLLRAGISRDARTKVDRTPLHVASQEGHIDIVELLIRNGADIEAKDMLKMTALHWAVEKGNIEIVHTLLKQGADVTCDNKFDKTPLEISISNGRTDIAQLLQLSQTHGTVEVMAGEPEVIEEVTTSPMNLPGALQHVVSNTSPVTLVPGVHTKMVTASGEEVTSSAAGNLMTDSGDQSSTSVLATLAALAEATGPLNTSNNTTAAEALNWLETHGITMISANDAPTMVSSSYESGQALTLTEAGKLALNLVKHESMMAREETEVVEETVETLENVVTDEDGQRVIAIVGDQCHLGDGSTVMVVEGPDGETLVEETVEDVSGEPVMKRMRLEVDTSSDSLDLKRQLEEVQRKAEEYKAQLQEKANEAEEYKKQLNEINAKVNT